MEVLGVAYMMMLSAPTPFVDQYGEVIKHMATNGRLRRYVSMRLSSSNGQG